MDRGIERPNRGTNRAGSDRELSRRIANYYRDDAERGGMAADLYDARMRLVLPQLEDLSRRGVESAFVLHALICTWLGRLVLMLLRKRGNLDRVGTGLPRR